MASSHCLIKAWYNTLVSQREVLTACLASGLLLHRLASLVRMWCVLSDVFGSRLVSMRLNVLCVLCALCAGWEAAGRAGA
jgi:hypothetical protein